MRAQLIASPDEHHWVLLDHRVTQLIFETTGFRLLTWALDGSAELRVAGAFVLRTAAGAARTLEPTDTASLGAVLALLRRRLASLTIGRGGELAAEFDGGTTLEVPPSRSGDAWELQGGGALEGVLYRSPAGGGVPWLVE